MQIELDFALIENLKYGRKLQGCYFWNPAVTSSLAYNRFHQGEVNSYFAYSTNYISFGS